MLNMFQMIFGIEFFIRNKVIFLFPILNKKPKPIRFWFFYVYLQN